MKSAQSMQNLSVSEESVDAKGATTSQAVHQTDGRFEELYLFANLSKQFRSLRIKPPILDKLLRHLLKHLAFEAAFLHLPDHPQFSKLVLSPKAVEAHGGEKALITGLQKIIPASLKGASQKVLAIKNSHAVPKLASLSVRPYQLVAAGIRHQKKGFGWLGLATLKGTAAFDPKQVQILETLANQLAVMLANMSQYDNLEQFTISIVSAMVCAIEAKDAYTKGHSERVLRYAIKMAHQMKLDARQIEALKWAAILHDIGKIGIPERILQKPSNLTPKEFDLIKKHPQKAAAILKPIKQLGPSMAGIVHHHERYNGTGYPDGLRGDKIPLAARILAVVDTFDAITSPRSYHKRKSIREAMLMLDQVAGTQLDPYLIRIFKTAYRFEHKNSKLNRAGTAGTGILRHE